MNDYTSYMNAVNSFYNAAAEWSFEKSTVNDKEKVDSLLEILKEKAIALEGEMANLPLDMRNSTLISHINKILSL